MTTTYIILALNLVFIGKTTHQAVPGQETTCQPHSGRSSCSGTPPQQRYRAAACTSCFLADIKIQLWYMNGKWWPQCGIDLLGASCALRNTYTEVYYNGYGLFDRRGGRTSLTLIPAAQQDLIVLALEVLARSPIANAAASQREAFRDVHIKIVQTAMTVMTQAQGQADSAGGCPASSRLLVSLRKLRTKLQTLSS